MQDGDSLRIHLPAHPSAPGSARAFVSRALVGWGRQGDVEVAVLLVSELVTNAIQHAASDVDVEIRRGPNGIRVVVHDRSPRVPLRVVGDSRRDRGRGLELVEALSAAWGVEPSEGDDDGKGVWFDLAPEARTG